MERILGRRGGIGLTRPLTDQDLITQVLTGKKEEFSILIQRYQQDAYKLSMVILKHRADAEDAVSEAFVKAFKALPSLREDSNFKSWLLTITHNCCQDILRKKKKDIPLNESQVEALAGGDTPLQQVVRSEEKQALWAALLQLPQGDRTAIVMKYYHNASYDDISRTLQWPPGTVASKLSRAREKLRKILDGGEIR